MVLTPADASRLTREVCALAPIVPVLVVHDAAVARPLAEALIAGGLPALEVTLRSPAALDAIRAMAQVPGGHVGAGTLITPGDVRAAKAAGATFGVSPGATDELLAACEAEDLPLLPGAATATEAMLLLARGYDMLKFFPAEASGAHVGRRPRPQGDRRAASPDHFLPDRRCQPGQRARLSRPAQRDLRRGQLGRTTGTDQQR